MENVLLKDVLPHIWVWTLTVICILLFQAYHLWRFGKKYPEIFKPDTIAENRQLREQKAELKRQYKNQSLISISIIFVWMIGMVVICFNFDGGTLTKQGWFILALAFCTILWILSMIQRKSKN